MKNEVDVKMHAGRSVVAALSLERINPDELAKGEAEAAVVLANAAAEVYELTDRVKAFEVKDAAGSAQLTEVLALGAGVAKRIAETRLALTRPLKTRAKAIEDAVRPLTDALSSLDTEGKARISRWLRAERERVEKERAEAQRIERERARLEAEREAAAVKRRADELAAAKAEARPVNLMAMMPTPAPIAEAPVHVAEAPRGVKTDFGSIAARVVVDFKVVNINDVPRKFLAVDEKAIREAIRAGARGTDIFGVLIFETEELAVRAKR